MKSKRNALTRKLLFALQNYVIFFLLAAFVTTCCMVLFLNILTDSLAIELTSENIGSAAKVTFLNVLLLSLIFTVIDAIRRKLTVENNIKRLARAADRVINGDFSVRIPYATRFASDSSFNEVVDCFNKIVEELSSVETLRTDFVSNVSHELKTPLTVIRNYARMLESDKLDDATRKEYARAISNATHRLSEMMTNILKLNRLENQSIYPAGESYDLSEQLCEALLEYESVWEERNITIDADIPENIYVCADRELLAIVWSNLLSNAFKFTDDGGSVSLLLSADESNVCISVADTGCGISRDIGEHIFEKFYQGDTSRATQGNGLGLALVKRIVDILQGEISVDSTVGVGTTFTVKIRRNHNGLEEDI